MTDIKLAALDGTHPLGFLAACGLLRIVVEELGRTEAELWFEGDGAWLRSQLDLPALIDALGTYLARRADARELGRAGPGELPAFDTLKAPLAEWNQRFRETRRAWLDGDEEAGRALAFLAAFVTDLVTAGDGITSKPTALDMTAGQQQFVKDARKLVHGLVAATLEGNKKPKSAQLPADLREALEGPWTYRDGTHPMGWDPWAERLHAYQAVAPTKDKRGMTSRAAVWLAFEGLPLFPVLARAGWSRAVLGTTGFTVQHDEPRLCWPVWSVPASLNDARCILTSPEVHRAATGDSLARSQLRARGVSAVCRSLRADLGTNGYAILRPPEVITLGGSPTR